MYTFIRVYTIYYTVLQTEYKKEGKNKNNLPANSNNREKNEKLALERIYLSTFFSN